MNRQIAAILVGLLAFGTLSNSAMARQASDTVLMHKTYASSGWTQLFRAAGDLNKDGLDDVVLVIDAPDGVTKPAAACSPDEGNSNAPVRRLIIYLTDADGNLVLNVDEPTALFRQDEGGVLGDPFEELSIKHGSIILNYYGGSRDRWSFKHQFRLDGQEWQLIGMTEVHTDAITNASISYDYNPLSQKLQVIAEESPDETLRHEEPLCVFCRTGENCQEKNGCYAGSKISRSGEWWFDIKPKRLVTLSRFRCWVEQTGFFRHVGFNDGR